MLNIQLFSDSVLNKGFYFSFFFVFLLSFHPFSSLYSSATSNLGLPCINKSQIDVICLWYGTLFMLNQVYCFVSMEGNLNGPGAEA